ncbi:MAG: DNA primase [Verrucomicrobia bacterium]|nr:DNA primase [Verrucomicrobiota bacterium]MDE3098289.1 DNA primase [Verrucomicrobiota bacterium]
MPGFSSATIERVRAASDIVDVIGSFLPLKKAGANFLALCPFHKEKTPSFNVNPHRQIFHCFGCHKGGDVFTFVKEYENIGFVDAVRRLADRAKIPLESSSDPAERQSRHLKDQLLEIHEKIAQRWQNCLANEAAGQAARDYLAGRGVGAEAVKLFRLGASPDGWDDTVNWARSKGYDPAVTEKSGLIIRKTEEGKPDEGRYHDRFRGRLMFPICDEQGRVIGFSGRILADEKTAKYVNSPETPIFTKGKVFYGLDKSKRAILDAGFAIICEGQLDLIACFMGGIQNVVAPQGTAFTEQHGRILKRYADEAVLCFDSDEAGQEAAMRSLDHLLSSGMAVRVAVVPAPHDPDSFIKEFGGKKFMEIIGKAQGFFDYYLTRLCQQNDPNTDKGRLAVLQAMADAVHKTGSAVLIDTYAQKTALRLGVAPEAVRAGFSRAKKPKIEAQHAGADAEAAAPGAAIRPPHQEFWLLKLLLLNDDLVPQAVLRLDTTWISYSIVRKIVEQRFAAQRSETWHGLAAFLDECDSAERTLVTEAVAEDRPIPNKEQQLSDMILKLRNQFLDRQIAELSQKAAQPDIAHAQQVELERQKQKLKEQKRAAL